MLRYSLQLEPLHKARDLVQELIAVLKGRLIEGRVYVNDQRMHKHVQEVLSKAPLVTALPVIQSFSSNKYKEIEHLQLEPQIISKCRDLVGYKLYFIHVAGRVRESPLWDGPKWMFYLEHFDLVTFDKDGQVNGKHIITNRLIKTHLDMSGLLSIKFGKLVGFQRRIMWKRVKGQRTILLSHHHCWCRLGKGED